MVGVFFDLFREEQLRDVEVRVTLAGIVVERPIEGAAGRERATGRNELADELARRRGGPPTPEFPHRRGWARPRAAVGVGRARRWRGAAAVRGQGGEGRQVPRRTAEADVADEFF